MYPDNLPSRPKDDARTQLERDVEAYLARGGTIRLCPTGVSSDASMAGITMILRNEPDAIHASKRLRAMAKRGTANSIRSKRGMK